MTEKFKILAKYIKDMSSETPDIETFLFVKENISNYKLNIDITSKALKNKLIVGELVYNSPGYDIEILAHMDLSVDLLESTVEVESLRSWLKDRGSTTGFFSQSTTSTDSAEYLDPGHLRYAPKLAAAVKAW